MKIQRTRPRDYLVPDNPDLVLDFRLGVKPGALHDEVAIMILRVTCLPCFQVFFSVLKPWP